MSVHDELQKTIADMVDGSRGILAADESSGTIAKRFAAIGVESTEENRRFYRASLLSAEGLGDYISGVILFEETLGQVDDRGVPLPDVAAAQNIVPGIKVDKGKGALPGAPGDLITYGLDGLAERLAGYKEQGARFAKWREVYPISPGNPTRLGLTANAEMLARYAAVCQSVGVVPIVEPEVLMDGNHDIERDAEVNEWVWHEVFHALYRHGVVLELMILKPSMVTPGKESTRAVPEQVAEYTMRSLRRAVPAAVPSINFLSGGQGPEEATANLNALNQLWQAPWQLSFSYGRALQEPALKAWAGRSENGPALQRALLKRARLNHLAMRGEYRESLELE
ncbi:class I fructose-bisphosphate aldolase [Microbulbifer thermotolerans]|uniref:Probable fructose-bisphosphate aldolase class 1 n=1 Tax=Microbulbifer thermotolerans TaxID=252514 RepID=A0A143HMF2_MICTH|nr:class I fructose-bisphosphate aldolase [Microbulbifer thermotolerans]AMX02868.1 fructose-bisphosphate aldolase [Microbulbifer thermotolerans]MCX2780508.1 fructose-bisphosphate aldolase class I [Microbulbifer thermotolerans]MCX2806044.1 fructose-bisphosphate aldolase class I [Microbulbifer thermotolerans]MCX2831064.1 fructose-bisphosphate aldolase class I [Microbulbifer thermotolerans]MCX2835831.1 fructose-bisphosphate aldolase class I [Microbulbifer thermotolerans]